MPGFATIARRRGWAVVALAAWLLATARAGSIESHGASPAGAGGPPGRPIAIDARGGRARFEIPAHVGGGSSTLVIVSALARNGGPYPIRLSARPIDRARPPVLASSPLTATPSQPARGDLPPLPPLPAPVASIPPGERTFHLMVGAGDPAGSASYQTVVGRLRAVGRRVQVYVDSADVARVDPATLRDLVATFDDRVFPLAAARFGPAKDIDGDGRFTILLSGWLAKMAGGQVSVDGFVRGADLDASLDAPFGNRCDMMYLNIGLKAGPHLRTVVAHEYTHAVTYSRKALPVGPEEEGWLDEALAHLVEDALGFSRSNIDYRVSAFLSEPSRYRLVVDDYYAADLFRSHGNRGATYLFLRWCVDRYGPGLLDALIRSDRRGVANLEAATGSDFADLFRRWTLALYLTELDPAIPTEGHFRSVKLRSESDNWVLAGPRASTLIAGGPADSWSSAGTAAHFTIVESASMGAVAIEVEAPADAGLQVTAVELPAGLARPELIVNPWAGPDGSILARTELVERGGTPIRLETLAWERLVPPSDPHAPAFRRDRLDSPGLVSAFGSASLTARGTLQSRPIPLPGVRPGDGPVVFKAIGTDPQGRRIAAWAVVNPPRKLGGGEAKVGSRDRREAR